MTKIIKLMLGLIICTSFSISNAVDQQCLATANRYLHGYYPFHMPLMAYMDIGNVQNPYKIKGKRAGLIQLSPLGYATGDYFNPSSDLAIAVLCKYEREGDPTSDCLDNGNYTDAEVTGCLRNSDDSVSVFLQGIHEEPNIWASLQIPGEHSKYVYVSIHVGKEPGTGLATIPDSQDNVPMPVYYWPSDSKP